MSYSQWRDPYHLLLTVSWSKFFTLIGLLYLLSNAIFACAYLLGGNCIEHARSGSFLDAFFFSVQTMATIGYGNLAPRTLYAHGLVTIEALVGLLGISMATGLMFSRFSRPTAKVLFSRIAVIAPHEGLPTLMFRAANVRPNQILEAQIRMHLLKDEITAEGRHIRRICDLKLLRSRTPAFSFSWQVMHPIDENSPLFGETLESLADGEATILITLTGIDETVSQTVHARHSFNASQLLWNMHFVDIISVTPQGQRVMDYTRFHEVVPLQEMN
jgi:inward rectifier potassium channel